MKLSGLTVLWLFNSLLWKIAHLQMIFPARNLHLQWIVPFNIAMDILNNSIVNYNKITIAPYFPLKP